MRGPWRAAAERARPCRTPRGSSAPRAASPTGSPAVSPSKPPFSCTSPGTRRAGTAGAWPRRAARLSVLGTRAGPSPPWAPRRRRSARLVAADGAKQMFEKPNCTSTYGTSSSRGERRLYHASSSSAPPRPIPRWNRLGASYTMGKTAELGDEAGAERSPHLPRLDRLAKMPREPKCLSRPVLILHSTTMPGGTRWRLRR